MAVFVYSTYEAAATALVDGQSAGRIQPNNVYVISTPLSEVVEGLHRGHQVCVDRVTLDFIREDFLALGVRLPAIESFPADHPHVIFRLPPGALASKSGS